jgi:hypothetical protein
MNDAIEIQKLGQNMRIIQQENFGADSSQRERNFQTKADTTSCYWSTEQDHRTPKQNQF